MDAQDSDTAQRKKWAGTSPDKQEFTPSQEEM